MDVVTESNTSTVNACNSEQKENHQVRTVTYVKPSADEPSSDLTTGGAMGSEEPATMSAVSNLMPT